jgi:ligand-binding sensor domain-containing protein
MSVFNGFNKWFKQLKLNRIKKWIIAAIVVALLLFVGIIYLAARHINRGLTEAAALQASAARIEARALPGARVTINGLQLSLAAEARVICRYRDLYYVATAGGLLAYDDQGNLQSHYTNLDGLPSLDLVSLAVYRARLYIGSADGGLSAFDGHDFINYQINKPEIRRISALLTDGEQLLIGSFDGGLLGFDGVNFTRRDKEGAPIPQITALLRHAGRLYVGTYANGLSLWQEGRWRQLGETEGLPSNHVTALIDDASGVIVATDFGVARLGDGGEFQPLDATPNITSLARARGRVWAGLLIGGFIEIDAKGGHALLSAPAQTDPQWHARGSTVLWAGDDNSLFALTRAGLLRADGARAQLEFTSFGAPAPKAPLTAAQISAIAMDEQGRLWLGYFDRGIDIFAPESMEKIAHLEDESVREINFMRADREQARMLVATGAGLAIFDAQLRYRMIDERAGISSNAVAHVSILPDKRGAQLALATGRGLTLLQGAIARTPISLPNNYLYTSAVINDRLYIGSLGGLIEMDGLRAARTFTIANSKISHNWINALLAIDGSLYIGTNGGGVDALLPSGELINFAPQIGKFDVNPNAMYTDGQHLFVGTLGNGVFILTLATGQWQRLVNGLPSLNIGAIGGDDNYIFFGSANGVARFERRQLNL